MWYAFAPMSWARWRRGIAPLAVSNVALLALVGPAHAQSAAAGGPPPPTSSKPPALTPPGDASAPPPTSALTRQHEIELGLAGVSAAGIITAIVLGMKASDHQVDAYQLCPNPAVPCTQADQANALIRAGHRDAVATNIALGIGAVAGIAAGVLWVTGEPDARTARPITVVPSAAPGTAGIVAFGRF